MTNSNIMIYKYQNPHHYQYNDKLKL